MKVYVVIGGAIHSGCVDNWADMDETELEKIFSTEEKALNYILNGGYFKSYKEHIDDDDWVVPSFAYNEEDGWYETQFDYGDRYVYYIKEMEVEE